MSLSEIAGDEFGVFVAAFYLKKDETGYETIWEPSPCFKTEITNFHKEADLDNSFLKNYVEQRLTNRAIKRLNAKLGGMRAH